MKPQTKHRQLVTATESQTREEIVAELAPLEQEQSKYLYERILEHRMGSAPSTLELRE